VLVQFMTHSEQDKMHQVSQHAVTHLDSGAGPCCLFETLKFLLSCFVLTVCQHCVSADACQP